MELVIYVLYLKNLMGNSQGYKYCNFISN